VKPDNSQAAYDSEARLKPTISFSNRCTPFCSRTQKDSEHRQSLLLRRFSMALPLTVACVGLLAVIVLYMYSHLKPTRTSTLRLPPGPKGLPILGNIHDLPKAGKLECHHWAEHKDLYGKCRVQIPRTVVDACFQGLSALLQYLDRPSSSSMTLRLLSNSCVTARRSIPRVLVRSLAQCKPSPFKQRLD